MELDSAAPKTSPRSHEMPPYMGGGAFALKWLALVKRSSSVERKCFPVLPVITFDADGALPAASAAPDTLSGGNKSGTGRKPILTCANARGHTCGRTQVGAPRGDEVLVQPGFSGEQQRAAHVGMPFDLCLLHSCY